MSLIKVITGGISALALQRRWAKKLEKLVEDLSDPLKTYMLNENECEAGAKGYIGQAFYEINGGKNPKISAKIGIRSAEILYLYRVCDDAVDSRPGRAPNEKVEIIDKFWQAFQGYGIMPVTMEEEAGIRVARRLGDKLRGYEGFKRSFGKLIRHLKETPFNSGKRDALENAKEVGRYCIHPLTQLIPRYGEELDFNVEEAGRQYGAAAQILDDMMDLETNVQEGIMTYPIFRLKELKRPLTKEHLRESGVEEEMKDMAKEELDFGRRRLTRKQRKLYDAISDILIARSYMTHHWGIRKIL